MACVAVAVAGGIGAVDAEGRLECSVGVVAKNQRVAAIPRNLVGAGVHEDLAARLEGERHRSAIQPKLLVTPLDPNPVSRIPSAAKCRESATA